MKYIPTIGLELHCALNTQSKVFSSAINSYNEIPNANIAVLDMAFPGTLPVLNKEAVRKALRMSLALNCEVPEVLTFDRKNYYYPDLPKGYQITQSNKPIGINGYLDTLVDGKKERIYILDIHLEEDTASMDHYDDYSLIDYNRAGSPLVEIVTKPCIHSAESAVSYLETLRNTLKYCDISDADTKMGQIRCDVNVSLAEEGTDELGTKVEIKNINSFSKVGSAIEYEIKRQTILLENNQKDKIIQETRRYDEDSNSTISMREKIESVDYKYFTEPNIPKFKLEKEYIESIKQELPILPFYRLEKYINEFNLSEEEATKLIKDKDISDYFDECIKLNIDAKIASNWITVNILSVLNKEDISIKDFYMTPVMLKQIIDKINDKTISSKQAKEIFNKALEEKCEPKELIKDDMAQVNDEEAIRKIIKTIIDNNQQQVIAYRNGKDNLFKYFVGQVMKETKGKANPVIANNILKEYLDK